MKKVFVPSKAELYKMQDFGVNIYNYLICKAIDSLILRNGKGHALENLSVGNRDIIEAICKMYPEEIKHLRDISGTSLATIGISLARKSQDRSVSSIDNLTHFSRLKTPLENLPDFLIMQEVITTLAQGLPQMPEYRYEYKEPNPWLDMIFHGKLDKWLEDRSINWAEFPYRYKKELSTIEPYYGLKDHVDYGSNPLLDEGTRAYLARYGMTSHYNSEYQGNCDLDKPNTNVKKLVRIITNGGETLK